MKNLNRLSLLLFFTFSVSNSSADVNTILRPGKVNLLEVGGSGLHVLSVYSGKVLVGPDGAVSSFHVSAKGRQMVVVADAAEKGRAMALSVPGATLLTFDADSTALAQLYTNGGIGIGEDPNVTSDVLDKLRSLVCFPGLVALYKSKLKTHTVDDLAFMPEVNKQLYDCKVEAVRKFSKRTPEQNQEVLDMYKKQNEMMNDPAFMDAMKKSQQNLQENMRKFKESAAPNPIPSGP